MKIFRIIVCLLLFQWIQAFDSKPQKKISIFSTCNRSHIRFMLSIAKELVSRPDISSSVTISRQCVDLVKSLNLNISLEIVPSSVDFMEYELGFEHLGFVIGEMERDWVKHYTFAWKNKENRPSLIISDVFTLAAFDLAEIFDIPVMVIQSGFFAYDLFDNSNLNSEYLDQISLNGVFPYAKSTLERVFSYFKKKFDSYQANQVLITTRNNVRKDFGLDPVSTICESKTRIPPFVIVESFFGFEVPRILPPNFEMVGILQLPELFVGGIDSDLEK